MLKACNATYNYALTYPCQVPSHISTQRLPSLPPTQLRPPPGRGSSAAAINRCLSQALFGAVCLELRCPGSTLSLLPFSPNVVHPHLRPTQNRRNRGLMLEADDRALRILFLRHWFGTAIFKHLSWNNLYGTLDFVFLWLSIWNTPVISISSSSCSCILFTTSTGLFPRWPRMLFGDPLWLISSHNMNVVMKNHGNN